MDEEATAALREAVEIHRARGTCCGRATRCSQHRRSAREERGSLTEARAAVAEAVTVLEQLPPGPELARTYNTMGCGAGVGDDGLCRPPMGERALELAEQGRVPGRDGGHAEHRWDR